MSQILFKSFNWEFFLVQHLSTSEDYMVFGVSFKKIKINKEKIASLVRLIKNT